ncbi:hypothetical protein QJQ45_002873 [Haematococcus lacustris]|nr:hypothetical protein QJQ45_002873 [Haematococcus lacustris]
MGHQLASGFLAPAQHGATRDFDDLQPITISILTGRHTMRGLKQCGDTSSAGACKAAADSQGSGLLSQSSIKAILKELSFQVLGLTTLQMITLLSQAPTSPDGLVSYIQFVPMAAAMIYSMYDVDNMKLRLQAIKEASAAGGMRELSQLDIEGLRELLEGAFQTVDPQGNGQLSLPQVMEVLSSLGTLAPDHMQLTDLHMRAMFAAIDADESGTVDWFELVNFICDAIEHMEREAYIEQPSHRCAAGPGSRPLSCADERAAHPCQAGQAQEWVYLRGKALLRKWQ